MSENCSFLAVLLASPGDENCIIRTVANDTCLQVDGQKVLQYLISMIDLSFASCKYSTTIANELSMSGLQCFRPWLRSPSRPISRAASSAFLRFYSVAQAQEAPRIRTTMESLEYSPESYPRIRPQKGVLDYKTFAGRYRSLARGETSTDEVVIRGMSHSSIWVLNIAYTPKEELCLPE